MSATSAFTTTRETPRLAGLRNRLSAFRKTTNPKEDEGEVGRLEVMHEDGAERVLEDFGEEEEDDAIIHTDMSASSSTSVGSEGRDVVDDPALDVGGKVDGADKQIHSPPRRRSSSRKPSGTFATLREDRGERRGRSDSSPPVASSNSGWLGVDISLIIALASPIGSLLTGSDHFKNVILILLLIYYLHQLVEVPWSLYRMSIPRHAVGNSDTLAELRTLEVFYLALTVLSPFLGSTLLRYVAKAVTGKKESLSWFSTSLFILATGIRPWTHVVERLKNRSEALNNILKEEHERTMGKAAQNGSGQDIDLEEELGRLRIHVHALDNRLSDLSDKTDDDIRDFSDHLDELIDTVEIKFRRHRAELARGTQSQDSRLAALESQVQLLTAAVRRADAANADHRKRFMDALIFFHTLFTFPWTMVRGTWTLIRKVVAPEIEQPVYYRRRLSRSHSSPSLRSSLASIPEEDQSTQYGADADESGYTIIPAKRSTSPGVLMSLLLAVTKIFLSPLLLVLRIASFFIGIPKIEFGGLFS
ncbi:hypothetical protein SCHPADRAFT_994110 [Schizopora paradoxa]|uniref:Uncharacterized protein n=1 Tax=Schizopora paradoxa TaxID=27342 RepID=A0A0H2S1N2_9AGAM|nr:hypothetical protein SCHPADRAFT_994110 [Schizopora paradoxa]